MLQQATKKVKDSEAFSEVEHRHDDPVLGFDDVPDHKSIIYITTRLVKGTHQQVILQQNIQNTIPASEKNQ